MIELLDDDPKIGAQSQQQTQKNKGDDYQAAFTKQVNSKPTASQQAEIDSELAPFSKQISNELTLKDLAVNPEVLTVEANGNTSNDDGKNNTQDRVNNEIPQWHCGRLVSTKPDEVAAMNDSSTLVYYA